MPEWIKRRVKWKSFQCFLPSFFSHSILLAQVDRVTKALVGLNAKKWKLKVNSVPSCLFELCGDILLAAMRWKKGRENFHYNLLKVIKIFNIWAKNLNIFTDKNAIQFVDNLQKFTISVYKIKFTPLNIPMRTLKTPNGLHAATAITLCLLFHSTAAMFWPFEPENTN